MNSSTNSVVLQILHLNGFIDDSLTRECSITVNQDRYDNIFITSFLDSLSNVILSANTSHNDWINALQMGWISKYLTSQLFTIRIFSSE